MGNAVRDYIPDPGEATELERERFERARLTARGQAYRDFLPGPDHVLAPPSGSKAQQEEALERAIARQATAAKDEYDAVVLKLKDMTVAQAINFITLAPVAVQEMALVAESLVGNRTDILEHFPEVDPAAVARWKEIAQGPKPQRRATKSANQGGRGSGPVDASGSGEGGG